MKVEEEKTAKHRRRSESAAARMCIGRRPRRRAVVIGCNYAESGNIKLKGAVNDAHLFALALVNLFEFHPKNILLLTDHAPDDVFLAPEDAELKHKHFQSLGGSQLPVRTHITLGLKWLVSGTVAGDVLVFFFAGHGLQVDDLSGWEGEGYDECILPMDCSHRDGEINAMSAVSIRNILLSVDTDVQISLFLDCTGGQTMLDPAGTGNWKYIKGVKQKGMWPFVTNPTDKMERARYNPAIWSSEQMKRKEVRPRFVPGVEVSNSASLIDHFGNGIGVCRAHAFLFAAAPFDQVAIEARLPSLGLRGVSPKGELSALPIIPSNKPLIHVVRAMSEAVIASVRSFNSTKAVTYGAMARGIERYLTFIRSKQGLPRMNQTSELTIFRPSGSSISDLMFFPLHGRSHRLVYTSATEKSQLERRETNWLPRMGAYMTAWQAEASLSIYGNEVKPQSWLAHQAKLHRDWEVNFRNRFTRANSVDI